jgi:cell division inhibitor SulA/protein ImuA
MVLEEILQRHPVWRGGALAHAASVLATGFAPLDAQLPGGGWPTAALTELLSERPGIGELQLVLPALAALTSSGRRVVWLAPPHLPYPPALAAAGLDLTQLAVLRMTRRRDALWSAEQVLRAGAAHALLAWLPELRYAELQRLAVAAEASQAFAVLFRPHAAARESSPAGLRLALEPGGAELVVRIIKRRGAPASAPLGLPLNPSCHALGRPTLPHAASRHARADRRLGLPVHA